MNILYIAFFDRKENWDWVNEMTEYYNAKIMRTEGAFKTSVVMKLYIPDAIDWHSFGLEARLNGNIVPFESL